MAGSGQQLLGRERGVATGALQRRVRVRVPTRFEALRGDRTVQAIAAKHEVHPNQVGTWKRQAIEGLDEVFAHGGSPGPSEHEATICDLHAKIANSRGFGRLIKWYCQPGPSPRVRGSPASDLQRVRRRGSIPACAGEPVPNRARESRRGVHPRVCGGATAIGRLS